MSTPARRTVRSNSFLALSGDLIGKVGLLVVLMISARTMSVEQFGLLGVCVAVYGICASALDAGSSILIQRDGARDPAVRRSLLDALLRARGPYLAVFCAGAVGLGLVTGTLLVALAVMSISIVSSLSLSLWAVVRAAEDFRPEVLQRLAAGAIGTLCAIAAAVTVSEAWLVIAGLAVGSLAIAPISWGFARRASSAGERLPAQATLAKALPLGALGIATLVYYRAPTVMLGALGTALATGRFTAAATVAFGLLSLPNAISSGLLPRLASIEDPAARAAVLRSALGWTLVLSSVSCIALAGVGPLALEIGFGPDYRVADCALSILLVATVMIAASGVVGCALIATGRTRWLMIQVAASLGVGLVGGVVMIPAFGAEGAALTTLASELVAFGLLGVIGARLYPGLWRCPPALTLVAGLATALAVAGVLAGGAARPLACAASCIAIGALPRAVRGWVGGRLRAIGALRVTVLAGMLGLTGLWLWATLTDYGLRVISDSPSFLVIVRALAARPLESVNPFLAHGEVANSHATPYTQLLGFGWRGLGIEDVNDPFDVHPQALYRYLSVVGLLVAGLVLHSVFVFVRSQAGPRAGWLSIPCLLLLLGPAHVIWAGDLSFHGLLYGSFFPQNLAIALCLYTLTILGRPGPLRIGGGCLLAAACLVVHPFTGVIMAMLLTMLGVAAAAARSRQWWRFPLAFLAGMSLGSAWPAYSLDTALAESGVRGWLIAGLVAGLCVVAFVLSRPIGYLRTRGAPACRRVLEVLSGPKAAIGLAVLGLVILVGLICWQAYLLPQPNPDPLINSNRLAVYWVEDRWRWPLMFATGLAGVAGLGRLALRGSSLCALWGGAMILAGLAGMAGAPVPVWWRFILFAQVPIACGLAVVFSESRGGLRRLIGSGLALSLAVKLVLLIALPGTLTYFGSALQPSWSLGQIIPPREGVVVSDPFSSYLVSAASGHRVLSVTKSHVGSRRELEASEEGYKLLRQFHSGDEWWQAAQEMYRRGVRFVLVEKSTSLSAPDLVSFSTGPTPLVRTDADRRAIGQYYYRLNRVSELLYDRTPYALFELSERALFPMGRSGG